MYSNDQSLLQPHNLLFLHFFCINFYSLFDRTWVHNVHCKVLQRFFKVRHLDKINWNHFMIRMIHKKNKKTKSVCIVSWYVSHFILIQNWFVHLLLASLSLRPNSFNEFRTSIPFLSIVELNVLNHYWSCENTLLLIEY